MIGILDYGVGNLRSIRNMFQKSGQDAIIVATAEEIPRCDKFILAGVGSFDHGMTALRSACFFDVFEKEALGNKKPVLGICLGMQMLTCSSEEGTEKGLGWVDANTVRFRFSKDNLPVPHMGWNTVSVISDNMLFNNLMDNNRFYFVHSYHVVCADNARTVATSYYGIPFTCGIQKDNIFGVQFHPEKSHRYGMQLLKNFGEY